MALVQQDVFEFDTDGLGSAVVAHELVPADMSTADTLRCILELDTISGDAGDTLNVFLCARTQDGYWEDRVAFSQVAGNATAPKVYRAVVEKFTTLADSEEEDSLLGPGTDIEAVSGSFSRLTAGTVQNGPYPGKYYTGPLNGSAFRTLGSSWAVQIVQVDADGDAQFVGRVRTFIDAVPLP